MATSSYSDNLTYVERDIADAAMMDAPLWDRLSKTIAKDKVEKGGKYYTKGTVKVKNGWNMRQVAEGGYRPTSYAVTVDETSFAMSKTMGAMTLTREELETGKLIGPNGVDIENVNLKGLMQSFAFQANMLIRGDTKGRITNTNGATTSTALVVDDAREFEVGMVIDVTKTTAADELDGVTITGVNKATNTLTVTSSTWTDGSVVGIEDSYSVGCIEGVSSILSQYGVDVSADGYIISPAQTSFGGISRSTYPNFQAYIHQPGGADSLTTFKRGDFFAAIAKMHQQINAQPTSTVACCDAETAAAIVDSFNVTDISMGDHMQIKVGTQGDAKTGRIATIFSPLLKNGSVELVVMPHFWRYTVAFLDESDLELRWTEPPHFVKTENGGILRYQGLDAGSTAPDSFVANYMVRMALVANPHLHFALVGVKPGESF